VRWTEEQERKPKRIMPCRYGNEDGSAEEMSLSNHISTARTALGSNCPRELQKYPDEQQRKKCNALQTTRTDVSKAMSVLSGR
jgi:hypothetical protein